MQDKGKDCSGERTGRERPSEEPEIEQCGKPAVLCPVQIQIFSDPENGRIAQCRFVDVEEDVANR